MPRKGFGRSIQESDVCHEVLDLKFIDCGWRGKRHRQVADLVTGAARWAEIGGMDFLQPVPASPALAPVYAFNATGEPVLLYRGIVRGPDIPEHEVEV
jgi:hypothetical protein